MDNKLHNHTLSRLSPTPKASASAAKESASVSDEYASDDKESASAAKESASASEPADKITQELPLWQFALCLHENKLIHKYSSTRLPNVDDYVFEFDVKEHKNRSNPGFGPAAGIITEILPCGEVGVRWFDTNAAERMDTRDLRIAPCVDEKIKGFYPRHDAIVIEYNGWYPNPKQPTPNNCCNSRFPTCCRCSRRLGAS